MRLASDPSTHLTYCSNIHPGESWMETFTNIDLYVPALRQALRPGGEFGIGLRLSDRAARELQEGRHLQQFSRWLEEHHLYVFTLNGFPYGGFHRTEVKDGVYQPDWTSSARVDYTIRLADILAHLLPAGIEGGISTSPISYKPWYPPDARDAVFRQGALNLAEVAAHLAAIRDRTGVRIHLDIEPEPDCLLENTAETIDFFETHLVPLGSAVLADRLDISDSDARQFVLEYVRVCYDTCHFAVAYEDPDAALSRLTEAGLRIGKVQISSALRVPLSKNESERRRSLERLAEFMDATYLHQVVERLADGTLRHHPDLPEALAVGPDPEADEWRVHFHVPVFVNHYGEIQSTRDDLERCLHVIREKGLCSHLEIETYTWEVLPADMKLKMSASIAREFEWVLSVLDPVPESVEISGNG